MAKNRREKAKELETHDWDDPISQITEKQIQDVIKELKLEGSVYQDRWIAAYHILHPELVNTDGYKRMLAEREAHRQIGLEREEIKEELAASKRKKKALTFEDICDIMLMEMENGDFSCLGPMTPRQGREIVKQILKYYEDEAELKRENPASYHILTRVRQAMPTRKAKAKRDTKQRMAKQVQRLSLAAEYQGLTSNTPVEALFDEQYNEYAFINTKYGLLVTIKVAEERWKGKRTILGEAKKIKATPAELAAITRLRTTDKMIEKIMKGRKRKISEDTSVRLNENMMLLKAFTRTD